jgi:hypothetical protein
MKNSNYYELIADCGLEIFTADNPQRMLRHVL